MEKRVTGALVADSKGKLVGILTESDCLKLLTLGGPDHEAPKGKVKDFMTSKVESIPPTMDIYYVAGLFLNKNFRRLPVVEDVLPQRVLERAHPVRHLARSAARPRGAGETAGGRQRAGQRSLGSDCSLAGTDPAPRL